VGAAGRRARPESRRPNCDRSPGRGAQLGPARRSGTQVGAGHLGCARSAATPAAQPGRSTSSSMGRRRGRGPATPAAGCRSDVGSARAGARPAGRADLGRAAPAATTLDATTTASRAGRSAARRAARSTQLGCDTSASGAGLGCATARRASRPGTSAGRCASSATTARCRPAACANLGIASSRSRPGCRCARSVVGFRAACRASAEPRVDRLGSAGGQLATGGATSAVMERARGGAFVGRAEDRGARGTASAVVGGAGERRAPGVDSAGAG
jgi:hypothetical protein